METLLNGYRKITVLLLVIMAQLVLLAVSAKDERDVRMIRVWTVTAVTPAARIVELMRGGGNGFLRNYILLHDTNRENRRLRSEEHTSELQSHSDLVCRLLLEKKNEKFQIVSKQIFQTVI